VAHRPLPRNVERRQGVDQARSAQGFVQSGWEFHPTTRSAKAQPERQSTWIRSIIWQVDFICLSVAERRFVCVRVLAEAAKIQKREQARGGRTDASHSPSHSSGKGWLSHGVAESGNMLDARVTLRPNTRGVLLELRQICRCTPRVQHSLSKATLQPKT
jgi:hypothetical protein